MPAYVFSSGAGKVSKISYSGSVRGVSEFRDVYCDISNNNEAVLDVRAPDIPKVGEGRLIGPRVTLTSGNILSFVPDQYNQRPENTFRYDMHEVHPEISWVKGANGNYVVTFKELEMISYDLRHKISLNGVLYCNVGSVESLNKENMLLDGK
jgi:hypothetical protein